jgi:hypothetical protein
VLATWDIRSKIKGKDLSRAHRQRTIIGTDIPSSQHTAQPRKIKKSRANSF